MWRTQQKLAEAHFFLRKLDEHYYSDLEHLLAQEPSEPVFAFYLSAFLSAARSVTWVMRSECGKVPGWEEWYASQELAESERALLRLFNDLRVRSEKIEPIIPSRHLAVEGMSNAPAQRDPRLPQLQVTITPATDDPAEKPIVSGKILEYSWTIDELDDGNLVDACRKYYDRLSRLVINCEAHFPPPSPST